MGPDLHLRLSTREAAQVWKTRLNGTGVTIAGYRGFEDAAEICVPETVGNKPVTAIGFHAFSPAGRNISPRSVRLRSQLTAVRIPDTVRDIGMFAFGGMENLRELKLPPRLDRMDMGLFEGDIALETVTLPEGVPLLPPRTFSGCTGLKRLELPAGTRRIDTSAFMAAAVETLVLPEGLSSIHEEAFLRACITEIYLPASLNLDRSSALSSCGILLIHAPAGSSAQRFAERSGIPFQPSD